MPNLCSSMQKLVGSSWLQIEPSQRTKIQSWTNVIGCGCGGNDGGGTGTLTSDVCSDDSGSISTFTTCSLFDDACEDDSCPSSVSTNNYTILNESRMYNSYTQLSPYNIKLHM